jgi:hypothetical protein
MIFENLEKQKCLGVVPLWLNQKQVIKNDFAYKLFYIRVSKGVKINREVEHQPRLNKY